ncbi:MAG: hypothetical protein ACXVB1_09840, partial [Pseudobdellovibrionaceae bacterium]
MSSIYYFQENTSKADIHRLSLLLETRQGILLAAKNSTQYLSSGKVKDLDEYNLEIVQLGQR